MNNQQVMEFIKQIQKDYKDFDLTTEEYEVWQNTLSKLDYDIALAKYEEHKLNSEFNKKAPDVKYFIYQRQENEKSNKKYLMKCRWCGAVYYNEAMLKHEDRHRSIEYIKKRKLEYWNKDTTYQEEKEFIQLSDTEFDKRYDEFLEKVYHKTNNQSEKRNIANILGFTNTEVQVNYKKMEG